ncbi:MAG: lysophospholipid acyltransferase family protein, partial [Planctomycetota bacterium]
LRGGIGLLVRRSGVPVVPVCIDGSFRAWPRGRRFPRPARVTVTYGEPVEYPRGMKDDEMAADLRRRLLALQGGPDQPPPGPTMDEAADSSHGGKGAA